jgi:hypothetical protein
MLSIIPLPAGFVNEITTNLGTILTDLDAYLTLIIGVILAVLVIEILIGALRK